MGPHLSIQLLLPTRCRPFFLKACSYGGEARGYVWGKDEKGIVYAAVEKPRTAGCSPPSVATLKPPILLPIAPYTCSVNKLISTSQ